MKPGSWENAPQGPRWQWLRCSSAGRSCSNIGSATAATYTVTATDLKHTIKVSETVENGAGRSKPATSPATKAVPVPPTSPPSLTTAPKISGTPTQGLTVTATAGSWSNQPFAFARQWLRCDHSGLGCVGISGATSLSYTLTGADVGHTLVLRETATNAAGATAGLSKPSGVVAGAVPVATLPPTINGVVQQGQTLTADHGRWTNEPTAYAYQWKRCNEKGGQCKPIAGAVARAYTPTSADVGKTLSVSETASNPTGAGKPSPSGATAKVLPGAPENVAAPKILGTAQVGRTLTSQAGKWNNGRPKCSCSGCVAKPANATRSKGRRSAPTRSSRRRRPLARAARSGRQRRGLERRGVRTRARRTLTGSLDLCWSAAKTAARSPSASCPIRGCRGSSRGPGATSASSLPSRSRTWCSGPSSTTSAGRSMTSSRGSTRTPACRRGSWKRPSRSTWRLWRDAPDRLISQSLDAALVVSIHGRSLSQLRAAASGGEDTRLLEEHIAAERVRQAHLQERLGMSEAQAERLVGRGGHGTACAGAGPVRVPSP